MSYVEFESRSGNERFIVLTQHVVQISSHAVYLTDGRKLDVKGTVDELLSILTTATRVSERPAEMAA